LFLLNSYKIGDIVDSLVDFCEREDLDPKRTYFWICAFCVNQHRVAETSRDGISVPTELFLATFDQRVSTIKNIVCMMAPWQKPTYLSRVWCIFEMSQAFVHHPKCKITVIMPPKEKKSLIDALLRRTAASGHPMDALYDALKNTKVQEAQASEEADRQWILALIKRQDGSFRGTNARVNERLREWVRHVVDDVVNEYHEKFNLEECSNEDILSYATACANFGSIYEKNADTNAALTQYRKCLRIRESVLGNESPETAAAYQALGTILYSAGQYEEALIEFSKCLSIQGKVLGYRHPETATTWSRIGRVLKDIGKFEKALEHCTKSLEIREEHEDNDPEMARDTALVHRDVASLLFLKNDYDNSLTEYGKCLSIQWDILGSQHPDTAETFRQIGSVYEARGLGEKALDHYNKCLEIQEMVLGADHPDTANTYCSIAGVCEATGNCRTALKYFKKCMTIREQALGPDHLLTAEIFRRIGFVIKSIGDDFDEALGSFQKCLAIQERVLGFSHQDTKATIEMINPMAGTKSNKGKDEFAAKDKEESRSEQNREGESMSLDDKVGRASHLVTRHPGAFQSTTTQGVQASNRTSSDHQEQLPSSKNDIETQDENSTASSRQGYHERTDADQELQDERRIDNNYQDPLLSRAAAEGTSTQCRIANNHQEYFRNTGSHQDDQELGKAPNNHNENLIEAYVVKETALSPREMNLEEELSRVKEQLWAKEQYIRKLENRNLFLHEWLNGLDATMQKSNNDQEQQNEKTNACSTLQRGCHLTSSVSTALPVSGCVLKTDIDFKWPGVDCFIRCPAKHPTELRTAQDLRLCDVCGRMVNAGFPIRGCKECDWDVCHHCTNVTQTLADSSPLQATGITGHGHQEGNDDFSDDRKEVEESKHERQCREDGPMSDLGEERRTFTKDDGKSEDEPQK
jgi:tetratricopeptide (TPR) repeat protein